MADNRFFFGNPDTDGFRADGTQELGLDDLENVAGGAGSGGSGMAEADGRVTGNEGNGVYSVDIGGRTVRAQISGKLRMNYVRIQPGDSVHVQYDTNSMKGRITYRYN